MSIRELPRSLASGSLTAAAIKLNDTWLTATYFVFFFFSIIIERNFIILIDLKNVDTSWYKIPKNCCIALSYIRSFLQMK